jgi:hypothetical protein
VVEVFDQALQRPTLLPVFDGIARDFDSAAAAVSRVAEWIPAAAGAAPELDRLLRPGEEGVDWLTREAAEDFRRGAELARLFQREVELAAGRALEALERGDN